MAVLKYKNPNYTVGGTEEKYLPLFNVVDMLDAYTKEESDNRYPKKSDVVKMMPPEVLDMLRNYDTGTTMTEDDYNTLLSFVTTATDTTSSNYGMLPSAYVNYLVDHPEMGFVKVYIASSSSEIIIKAYIMSLYGYMDIEIILYISKEDKSVKASGSQKFISASSAGEISIGAQSLDSNGSLISGGGVTLKTNGSGDKVLCDNGEYLPIESYTTATTVASLDVNYRTIYVTLSENASLSASDIGSAYNGRSIMAYVYTASSVTITIPTSGNYVSMCGSSFTTTENGWVEFSLVCVNGVWHIAKLEAE